MDINKMHPRDVITRDVCIIGGGASGTYGAIRLNDLGKRVVVVEQQSQLGGQTETYTDPASGNKTEMGVVAWYTNDIVNNFFARLNVSLKVVDVERAGFTTLTSIPVDFRTGEIVTNIYSGNVTEGISNYAAQLAKYPYLEDGFDIPYPVPSDFLLPFGEFVEKYNISGAIQVLNIFGNGMGDFLNQPTLYVFKLVSMETIQALGAGTFQATLSGDNHEVYDKAAAVLGENVLLNSKVVAVDRCGEYPEVVVQTPSGLKYIQAKKLLLAIPPKLENLIGFDLDITETSLFRQLLNTGYYTAIINNTGLPDDIEVRNFGADTPYNVPFVPGPYFVQASDISGLFNVKYCSPVPVSDEIAKANIVAAVQRLRTAGTLNTTTPDFVQFHSHTPFEMTVSVDAVQNGFYKDLYALQGLKNTYWTGAAFHSQDSSKLWAFTEKLLPGIIDGL
jgi:hypothetical protein